MMNISSMELLVHSQKVNLRKKMILKQVQQKMSQNSRNKLLTIGVGTLIVVPFVLPLLKPVAKATIKMGALVRS